MVIFRQPRATPLKLKGLLKLVKPYTETEMLHKYGKSKSFKHNYNNYKRDPYLDHLIHLDRTRKNIAAKEYERNKDSVKMQKISDWLKEKKNNDETKAKKQPQYKKDNLRLDNL